MAAEKENYRSRPAAGRPVEELVTHTHTTHCTAGVLRAKWPLPLATRVTEVARQFKGDVTQGGVEWLPFETSYIPLLYSTTVNNGD